VLVESDLSLPGQPDIFVVGDTARIDMPDGEPVPGVAPTAKQEGRYVAAVIGPDDRGFTRERKWESGSIPIWALTISPLCSC
jgi:NADH:quinone reductase (non-electrogenic)